MPNAQRRTIGDVVRERREELGFTKSELARRARLTRSSLHEIELDQRHNLQPRTYHALDQALEWRSGELRRRTGEVVADTKTHHPTVYERYEVAELRLVFDALMEALEEERLLHERLLEVLLKCGFEAPKYSVKRETKA